MNRLFWHLDLILHTVLTYSVSSYNTDFYKKSLYKLNVKGTAVSSYADFEQHLFSNQVDLVIVDLELDNTDAITVIKEINFFRLTKVPYIMVCSAKGDDFIQVSAFNSGADDYVELPVNSLVFESRIKALLKRQDAIAIEHRKGNIYIDHERYKVVIGKSAYSLPRLEFRMMSLLFSDPNKIFSKDEIAHEIWHNKDISSKRTIDIHIRNIRRVLGEDIIKTYRGLGYCLKSF